MNRDSLTATPPTWTVSRPLETMRPLLLRKSPPASSTARDHGITW